MHEVIIEMENSFLFVTGISDGSCLAVISRADADVGLVGWFDELTTEALEAVGGLDVLRHLDPIGDPTVAVALAAGLPPQRMVMHGNNKAVWELRAAMDVGVGRIIVDSDEEMHRITVWLDSCSVFYGVYEEEGGIAQLEGKVVYPTLE